MKSNFLVAAGALFLALQPVHANAGKSGQSDFHSLCRMTLGQEKKPSPTCDRINTLLFSSKTTKEVASVKPAQVNAPAMSIDSKIQIIVFNDPNHLPALAYCYFVYRRWINMAQISPDALGIAASGFSILNEDIRGYQRWIAEAKDGVACRKRVEKESELPTSDLEASLKNHVAIIGINPFAMVREKGDRYEDVIQEIVTTLNHERIHAYQVVCPELETWSQRQWTTLPQQEKDRFAAKYPSYNWKDLKVAGREFGAFLLEKEPKKIGALMGKCKIEI